MRYTYLWYGKETPVRCLFAMCVCVFVNLSLFVLPCTLKFRLSCLEYFSMNSTVVWVSEMFPRVLASHGIITLAAAVIAGEPRR